MKRRTGFWLLWGLALGGVSGCAMTEKQRTYTIAGAIGGAALGTGLGMVADVIDDNNNGDKSEGDLGKMVGAGAGAIIGGIIGYWLAGEEAPAVAQAPPPPAPRPAPAPAPAPPAPAESKRIVLRGINFDFDKSNIKAEFRPVLDEAARILSDNPNINVTIEGHTDSKGTDAYNMRLSERRARAVKQYLTSKGVAADRLTTVGRGESEPIAPNTTDRGKDNPEGRAMNRRAELKVQ